MPDARWFGYMTTENDIAAGRQRLLALTATLLDALYDSAASRLSLPAVAVSGVQRE